jgi:hypothetical protein
MERPDTISSGERPRWRLARTAWPFAACALALAAFSSIGDTYVGSWRLDLGSLTLPNVRHTYFLFYWTLFGSLATCFLWMGVTRVMQLAVEHGRAEGRPSSDRSWVILISVAAFLLPVIIRTNVLRGAPLTDDESAYRFMAEVLATGRLWVPSHPLKTFFDRVFMVNDGRFYGQYFVGWPALMVPGVFLGATGFMNAVYSALTVPAIFGIVRRCAGSGGARISTLLYLASPMLLVGAATEMSHPSCVMALAWSLFFLLRAGERPAAWWTHAGVAAFFGLAFLVRPTSALGIGAPLLAWWLWQLRRAPAETRVKAVLAFGVPAAALAAVFFAVNLAQNGSPLVTSYARMQAYMKQVNYQWVGWSAWRPPTSLASYMLPKGGWDTGLAGSAVAMVRLVFDLFGTPVFVVLAGFAWGARSARLAWASLACFFALHFFTGDSGVDTFGPVHYYETALPVLLLCGIGYARLSDALAKWRPALPPSWPLALVASAAVVALAGFAPVRFMAVKRIAAHVNGPSDAVRDDRISHAIVFTAGNFVPMDCIGPTRHFVYFRPNNDPALSNDILWANHLGWDEDQKLLPYFPGRLGYLLMWKDCRPQLMRIQGPGGRLP